MGSLSRQFGLSLFAFCLMLCASLSAADPTVTNRKGDNSRTVTAPTAGQESVALEFARSHHPELAKLIVRLKEKMTGEYEKAIRQLYLTHEKLARTKGRSPEDYDLQLEQWKVDSRFKLLAARMSISTDTKLDRQMAQLLRERNELKLQQLHRDQDRLQSRLSRIQNSIESLESNSETTIQKELERYRRQRNKTRAVSTKNKAEATSPKKKTTDN